MAAILRQPIPAVGTATFRPPFVPVPMTLYRGHNTGESFRPLKQLPLEREHREINATLSEYGGWLRPAWYGDEDSQRHIHDEILMARRHAGLFDASSLGKIEVLGPDAAAFLNFIYYNTVATLSPGQIRYGMMLTEAGIVFDDGVLARMSPDHFIVFCSSGHAAAVHRLLQTWRQDGHDPNRIFIHDATDQWATLTVTGPKARHALEALDLDIDLSAAAFPHMHLRMAPFDGNPVRIARVSFSGDLSFELSIGASKASTLWHALSAAIRGQNGGPIGLEALSVMRAEKGYIIAGRDTDGLTVPHDLGFGGPRQKKRTAFVGDRSLKRDVASDPHRRQLVGLRVPQGFPPLPTGAHLIAKQTTRSIGIVTSSYDSPTLGHPIALALLNSGAARHGERLQAYHLGDLRDATVCAPCFLDPAGERLNA